MHVLPQPEVGIGRKSLGKAVMSRGLAIPKWLSAEAKREWRRVVPQIRDRLTSADMGTVESYVVAVATVRKCEELLSRDGLTIVGDNGVLRPHPAVRMQATAMQAVKNLGVELGLSPRSRRHSADAVKASEGTENGWSDLLS